LFCSRHCINFDGIENRDCTYEIVLLFLAVFCVKRGGNPGEVTGPITGGDADGSYREDGETGAVGELSGLGDAAFCHVFLSKFVASA
jgi:hypothetical protein